MKIQTLFIPAIATAISISSTMAAEIGMKAPSLSIAEWVKGKPVDVAGKGIKVIEFWATWCGPCKESIPHLTDLQHRLKKSGVTIVGITDEDRKTVDRFLKLQGVAMDYTVAIDKGEKSFKDYMEAFGIDGIPHAFVVNAKGLIAWEGHPAEGLDNALEQMIAGKYDIARERVDRKASRLLEQYFEMAHHDDHPEKELKALGEKILKDLGNLPDKLNTFSWLLLTEEHVEHRDKPLALRAVQRANQVTRGKSVNILDTLAKAYFDNGKAVQAVAAQKEAIKLSDDTEQIERFNGRLKTYQAGLKK